MRNKLRKMIAPVVISLVLALYYVGVGAVFFVNDEVPAAFKIVVAIVTLALSGVAVSVLVQRIKEIRSGEEDDIGKY